MEISAEAKWVTTELIDWLISLDTHNRPKKRQVIDDLVRSILKGEWVPTCQTIGVSESGFIVDGGHRLQAIKEAGYPRIQIIITYGLPDTAQYYVDQNSRRTPADIMSLMFDKKITDKMSATLKSIFDNIPGNRRNKPTPKDLEELYNRYEWQLEQLNVVKSSKKLHAPIWAAIVETMTELNKIQCVQFAEQLISGIGLEMGNPIIPLRRYVFEEGVRYNRIYSYTLYEMTKQALGKYLQGKSTLILRIPRKQKERIKGLRKFGNDGK